ncbi:COR domain-containing protein [Flavobacterium sp. CSZ]|uniref:COR domain-containing protein n=1 Tax=Flavobacterium sp. CSZ TaxID=2783791 RepID=UPI00188A2F3C|nr:COR domain-containing protein [Flavobacterium sp. CSZ]MBF4487734.1 hypothetical protein [Flavobacterium sp. CSZ]
MLDFVNASVFDYDCEIIVVPVSTEGTISRSFEDGLDNLDISIEFEQKKFRLGDVYFHEVISESRLKFVAFACVVDNYKSAYFAIRLAARQLARFVNEHPDILEIGTPILGTGAGKLDHFKSRNIMLNGFYEKAVDSARLTFYTTDKKVYNSLERKQNDIDSPSAILVIEAELSRINSEKHIQQLLYDQELYFELAFSKFNEFQNFRPIEINFYDRIEQDFKNSKLPFQEFFQEFNSNGPYHSFLTLCGELIAYLDYNAYRKNFWNKYPDKRVLARAGVRQNDWFLNLLKFKRNNDLNLLSPSVRNALKYLFDPSQNLTMLSKVHRQQVFKEFLMTDHFDDLLENDIIHLFRNLKLKTINDENFGALCSRILYLPYIKPLWHDNISKQKDQLYSEADLYYASQRIEENLLKKSKTLDLGMCGLRDLCLIPELFECIHLEELILSNEWGEYEKGTWKPRYSKNKWKRNTIEYIPGDIVQLKNLKTLICGGDWNKKNEIWNRWPINNIHTILLLKQLKYLNLSNCAIRSLRNLSSLPELEVAFFNNNKIKHVDSFGDGGKIHEIYLSNNLINSVSSLADVKNISTIDLHNNKIKDLSPIEHLIENIGIENDKWKVGTINIAKNPLTRPSMEFVNLGKQAVLRVLNDIRQRGRYINKDIKIILVGNSEVGKSTMVKYLDNEKDIEQEHLPTLWMQEKVVKSKYKIDSLGEECLLHIFDFGGHDYYHDTHHLFYGANAVYILLWTSETNSLNLRSCIQLNDRREKIKVETQDYPIKYWLESVKYYIKDVEADNIDFEAEKNQTYNSSLLLLQNKVRDVYEIEFVNNCELKKDYPFIFDIASISIKSPKRNMEQFDMLLTEMLNSMDIIGTHLPKFYKPVKNSFISYQGKPVINRTEFMEYCNNLIDSPIDLQQTVILIGYLEQIGMLLYSEKSTEGNIYMDKKWLIDNIHNVLIDLKEKNGEFDIDYLITEKQIPETDIRSIIDMMIDFKIIFEDPFSEKYIAPLYLSKMPESKINLFLQQGTIPYRRFEYTGFIQKSIILSIFQHYSTMLLSASSEDSSDMFYYWKDGLIIKNPATHEIVMIKFHIGNQQGNACIDIFNLNLTLQKKDFIDEVLGYIKEISNGYAFEEMVTLDGIDYISTKVLDRNAMYGKLIFSEKKLKDFDQEKDEEQFFNLKDYKMFTNEKIKKKKVVISYSKRDLRHINSLIRYLQPLVAADLIEEPWYCTNLIPSVEWNPEIKERFDQADIVFFMVSEYFFNTKYILEHEVVNTIKRYDADKSVKIIPIILEFYDWAGKEPYNLQRFTALPYQAKPISDYHNQKLAWSTITKMVRLMIEKDMDPVKSEMISRELQEIYERQVRGSLDDNV